MNKKNNLSCKLFFLSLQPGLNRRPTAYKAGALPLSYRGNQILDSALDPNHYHYFRIIIRIVPYLLG